jgi:hypothetical protein
MAAKPARFHEDADAEYEDAFDWITLLSVQKSSFWGPAKIEPL